MITKSMGIPTLAPKILNRSTTIKPQFKTGVPSLNPALMTRTRTASTPSRSVTGGYTINQLKSFGYQAGLSTKQIDWLIKYYQDTGIAPNYSNYKSILSKMPRPGIFDLFGVPTTTVEPTVNIQPAPVIDNAVNNATGGNGVTYDSPTGFGVVDPTQEENFIQKNKAWLIPAGIGAAALTLYLITKKKK